MSLVTRGTCLALVALLTAVPAPAWAQGAPLLAPHLAQADSLLRAGQVSTAEAIYYWASRQRTRDPAARMALGRYLASRGAFRVGATLLDEATQFGADSESTARLQAPMLQAGDDWARLAGLRYAPLSAAERARAEWLAAHPPAVSGADSVTVVYEPSSTEGLGRVRLVIGTDTLAADIDPRVDELVLGDYSRYAALVRVFTGSSGDRAAVVERASIGDLVLERIPARIDPQLGPARARLGLTLLARLAPTIDAGASVLTLRREGRVNPSLGRRIAVVFTFPGVRIARPERLVPIESPAGRALLAQARWTLDARTGEVALEVDRR